MAYNYRPLVKGTQIRLLEIQPPRVTTRSPYSLQTYDLSYLPPYEAISYTWGSSEFDSSITCDGKRLPITSNCATMLHYLRLDTVWARRVWLDQICVNQNDIPERNDQVLLMTEIYSRAQQVIAWIGECSEEEKRCLELAVQFNFTDVPLTAVRMRSDRAASAVVPEDHSELDIWLDGNSWARKTLERVLSRSYFIRIWVIQEVTVAQRVILKCGQYDIDIQRLFDMDEFIEEFDPFNSSLPAHSTYALKTFRREYLAHGTLGSGGFKDLFFWTKNRLASDKRDKVYALRGICKGLRENTQPPDYSKSDVEIFIETAKASNITDQGRLTILGAERSPRHGTDLPTWCPDYGGPESSLRNIANPSRPSETLREKSKRPNSFPMVDGKRLIVKGKVIDSITRLSEADRWPPGRYQGDPPRLTKEFEIWRSWLSFMEPATSSYGEEPIYIALWRTLFNDTEGWLTTQGVLRDEMAMRLLNYVKALHARLIEEEPDNVPYLSDWHDAKLYENAYDVYDAFSCSRDMRACITNEKFFGLVPEQAEVGDVVVYLQGAEKLYLLRPQDGSRGIFTLVRDCYIHGLANGERYPSEDSELMEIVIV